MESNNLQMNNIEKLLQETEFRPSPDFQVGLHDRLLGRLPAAAQETPLQERRNGSHGVRKEGNIRRPAPRWRWALITAAAALAALAGMIGLVPAVQARVASLLRHFGVNLPFANAGLVISPFTPLAPADVPQEINYFHSLNMETDAGKYVELRYFNRDTFIVIYETPDGAGKTYPTGEDVQVGAYNGVLTEQHAGMVLLAAPAPQPWRAAGSGGGGGGGGGGAEDAPPMLEYDQALQLTWVQDGMWIEMLTNLPEDRALSLGGSMIPAPELIEK